MKPHDKDLIPINQVAREYNVNTETIRRWCTDGILGFDRKRHKLESVRRGRRWYTTREALISHDKAIRQAKQDFSGLRIEENWGFSSSETDQLLESLALKDGDIEKFVMDQNNN